MTDINHCDMCSGWHEVASGEMRRCGACNPEGHDAPPPPPWHTGDFVIDGALLATVETPETWQQRREANRAALRGPTEPKLCKCGTRTSMPQHETCGSAVCR